jgi:hypothetical protein
MCHSHRHSEHWQELSLPKQTSCTNFSLPSAASLLVSPSSRTSDNCTSVLRSRNFSEAFRCSKQYRRSQSTAWKSNPGRNTTPRILLLLLTKLHHSFITDSSRMPNYLQKVRTSYNPTNYNAEQVCRQRQTVLVEGDISSRGRHLRADQRNYVTNKLIDMP